MIRNDITRQWCYSLMILLSIWWKRLAQKNGNGNQLENAEKFTYLHVGRLVTTLNTYDLDSKKEIMVRIVMATAAIGAMDKIWKSKSIHKKLKLEVHVHVFSGMLYECEAWTITKVAEVKILAF